MRLSRTPWTGRCSPADYYGRSVIWSDFQAHSRCRFPVQTFIPLLGLRLLSGYLSSVSQRNGPGDDGCHQLPTRRPIFRSVLGLKQSSFHHVEIALRDTPVCWNHRSPSLGVILWSLTSLSGASATLGILPFPEEVGDCSPLR